MDTTTFLAFHAALVIVIHNAFCLSTLVALTFG